MMKRASAVIASGLLVAGSAVAATTSATASTDRHHPSKSARGYMPPPIEWGKCASTKMVAAGAKCGLLTVPLDYAHPEGKKIKIGVSFIKHKTADSAAQGIMLVNPGGPGGSGLNLARLGGAVPNHGGDPYDWIGFDPRGVGTSLPKLTCDGNYFPYNRPDYVPTTKTLRDTWLAKSAGYAAACAKAGGDLLNHMKTVDWVNDMESIRKAFKADKINYYGFSYGTYLGQVYATLHPDRVRRFVFDGVVNPKDVWYKANLAQDIAFDDNLTRYFGWIAQNDSTYHLGTTAAAVKKVWDDLLAQSRKAPLGGKLGPDEWTDAFQSAGYYVYGWDDTAHALVKAAKGDFSDAIALYDDANGSGPGSDNTFAVYNAVQCTDVQWPKNFKTWERDAWRIHATHPFMAWGNTWYNAPCLTWAAKPGVPVRVNGKKVPPILLIEETYDAATPWSGAIEVRKLFPKSILIEGVGGTTHAGSLSGVDCTDNRIADYLLTGKLDKRLKGNRADVRCEPVPPPAATAAK